MTKIKKVIESTPLKNIDVKIQLNQKAVFDNPITIKLFLNFNSFSLTISINTIIKKVIGINKKYGPPKLFTTDAFSINLFSVWGKSAKETFNLGLFLYILKILFISIK